MALAIDKLDACTANYKSIPDSKVHGANMGPIWDRQGPGGPHVGPLNFAIWDGFYRGFTKTCCNWTEYTFIKSKNIDDTIECNIVLHCLIWW